MGWTSYFASYFKNGRVDRKAECDALFDRDDGYQLLKSAMVGATWYAAIKHPAGHVFGCVFLTQVHDGEFYYKDMSEDMGPNESRCPVSILDLLDDTESEYAQKWRERCREYARRRREHKTLSTLPIGAIIRYKRWDGSEYTLQKMAPAYQFRTTWWYNEASHSYVPKKFIPETFEIVA